MKNIGYKKGIVFVIMVVMLLIVPSTLATVTPNVVKTLNNNIKSVDKPDLVILDVKEDYDDYSGWFIYANVLNDGTAVVPVDKPRTLKCAVYSPITGIEIAEYINSWPGAPTQPGKTVKYYLAPLNPDVGGICKLYFKADPFDEIDELNENNNVVWAYYYVFTLYYLTMEPQRLSKFHQVSKIPSSMPLNIP